MEEVVCWAPLLAAFARGQRARPGSLPEGLSLDVSWLPIPFGHSWPGTLDTKMYALSELTFAGAGAGGMEHAVESSKRDYLRGMDESIAKAKIDLPEDAPTSVPT